MTFDSFGLQAGLVSAITAQAIAAFAVELRTASIAVLPKAAVAFDALEDPAPVRRVGYTRLARARPLSTRVRRVLVHHAVVARATLDHFGNALIRVRLDFSHQRQNARFVLGRDGLAFLDLLQARYSEVQFILLQQVLDRAHERYCVTQILLTRARCSDMGGFDGFRVIVQQVL